jgi:hypothetical protein
VTAILDDAINTHEDDVVQSNGNSIENGAERGFYILNGVNVILKFSFLAILDLSQ